MKKIYWSNDRIYIYTELINNILIYSIYLDDTTYLDSTSDLDIVNSWIVSEKLIYNLYKLNDMELKMAH